MGQGRHTLKRRPIASFLKGWCCYDGNGHGSLKFGTIYNRLESVKELRKSRFHSFIYSSEVNFCRETFAYLCSNDMMVVKLLAFPQGRGSLNRSRTVV